MLICIIFRYVIVQQHLRKDILRLGIQGHCGDGTRKRFDCRKITNVEAKIMRKHERQKIF